MQRRFVQWYLENEVVPTGFYVAPRKLDVRAVIASPVLLVAALAGGLARAMTRPVVAMWREHVYLLDARWEPSAAYVAHARERAARGAEPCVLDDEALAAAALDPTLWSPADEIEVRRHEEG